MDATEARVGDMVTNRSHMHSCSEGLKKRPAAVRLPPLDGLLRRQAKRDIASEMVRCGLDQSTADNRWRRAEQKSEGPRGGFWPALGGTPEGHVFPEGTGKRVSVS